MSLTRSKYEELVGKLLDQTFEPVKKALADAKKKPGDINEVVMVGGMTRTPKVIEKVKEYFGKEPHSGVNPDEVVAIGAAIQGGVLTGDVHDITLLDVTPLSLGLETEGGIMTKLIERNTTIPVEKKQVFSTAADNQPSVEVRVLQGERPMANDNKVLGNFQLDGIRPAPRGVPRIEVSFDIDSNGILKVSAKDVDTGKQQDITIKASTNLSDEEIDELVKQAEKHAEEDKKKKDLAESRNDAESMVSAIEKLVSENKDKIEETDKSSLEEEKKKLQDLLAQSAPNIEELKNTTEEVSKKVYDITAKIASASQPTEGETDSKPEEEKTGEETGAQEGEVVS